jgi:DUF1365 family protein
LPGRAPEANYRRGLRVPLFPEKTASESCRSNDDRKGEVKGLHQEEGFVPVRLILWVRTLYFFFSPVSTFFSEAAAEK